jgi:hypothetical protein
LNSVDSLKRNEGRCTTFRHACHLQVHAEKTPDLRVHEDDRTVLGMACHVVASLAFEVRRALEWDGYRQAVCREMVADHWMLVVASQDHPPFDHWMVGR